jgi:hypothetical protein
VAFLAIGIMQALAGFEIGGLNDGTAKAGNACQKENIQCAYVVHGCTSHGILSLA